MKPISLMLGLALCAAFALEAQAGEKPGPKHARAARPAKTAPKTLFKRLLQRFDANHDGKITREDFAGKRKAQPAPTIRQRLRRALGRRAQAARANRARMLRRRRGAEMQRSPGIHRGLRLRRGPRPRMNRGSRMGRGMRMRRERMMRLWRMMRLMRMWRMGGRR